MANQNDQKKSQARQRREQIEAANAAAARRNRNIQILAGVIFSALVVVLIVVLIGGKGGSDAPAPDSADVGGVAETKTLLTGVEQRGLTIGSKKAPVTVIEFLDVQCPFCRSHQLEEQPAIIKNLVKTDRIKLRLAPLALEMFGEDSEAGRAVALRLAHKNKAWDFLNLFFFNQGNENTGYVTDEYLEKLVAAVPGTTKADANRTPDAEDVKIAEEIDTLANDLGADSTPAFAIGKSGQDPKEYELLVMTADGGTRAEQIEAAVAKLEKSGK